MTIKFTKLTPDVPTPRRAHPTDAGVDLTAHHVPKTPGFRGKGTIRPNETATFGTGIAVSIPPGYVGLLFVRSSIGCKLGLAPANAVGVIDSGYIGEVQIVLQNHSGVTQAISVGERICQLVIVPINADVWEQVDSLEATERGTGGFGSTGTTP